MKRKRYFTSHHPQQNLDSFLDILTNTVGVLMFISLFITLVAVQSSTIVRTPLVKESEKQVHFFEVSGNRVIYLNTKSVNEQIGEFIKNLPICTKPNYISGMFDSYLDEVQNYQSCLENKVRELELFRAQTKYYEVELVDLESAAWKYNLKSINSGEPSIQLNDTNSEYKNILSQLKSNEDYVAFLVRPDSFTAFRQAREIAWKAGFDVGWEPQIPKSSIIFSSQGRSVGVQ